MSATSARSTIQTSACKAFILVLVVYQQNILGISILLISRTFLSSEFSEFWLQVQFCAETCSSGYSFFKKYNTKSITLPIKKFKRISTNMLKEMFCF